MKKKDARRFLVIYSQLQRQANDLYDYGEEGLCNRVLDVMEELEDKLFSIGVEIYPEGYDEKLDETWKVISEAYRAVGLPIKGEKRIYRKSLQNYFKHTLGWDSRTISNFIADEPFRPMTILLDSGYIKAHGQQYWTLNRELHKED